MFHSCGDVGPLIGDFIELGIDILNPIQTSTGSMSDLPNLKKMGLGNIRKMFGFGSTSTPIASFGKMLEVSNGKDSTSGHWEI